MEADAFALPVPAGDSRRRHLLVKRQRRGRERDNQKEYLMHYIADDFDMEAWVNAGLARLERYLACWRLFTKLYRDDAS
jgi:hypothetical protein